VNEPGCGGGEHNWVMSTVWRSDGQMGWMMFCSRCSEFDVFGTDTGQSNEIWQLLTKDG
jgi:hypothetical protein